jgi:hypothetical protein
MLVAVRRTRIVWIIRSLMMVEGEKALEQEQRE